VAMSSQSGSGETGMTVLYAEGDRTRVVVQLDNPMAEPQPAHIHLGSCPMPNATPLYPLNAVMTGRSETVLDVNMGALVAQPMAINVHLSPQDIPVYVACGDIALDDDTTAETTIDSVRENAREDINQEQKRERRTYNAGELAKLLPGATVDHNNHAGTRVHWYKPYALDGVPTAMDGVPTEISAELSVDGQTVYTLELRGVPVGLAGLLLDLATTPPKRV